MEKKRTIWHAVICAGLVCLIWGGYFFESRRIAIEKHREITLYEDNFSWVYQVNDVKFGEKEFVFGGIAFPIAIDSKEAKYEIVLHDVESGENYFSDMEYKNNEKVDELFQGGFEYLYSEYAASFKRKQIDLQNGEYEILLRVLGEAKAYRMGMYLSKGKMAYTRFDGIELADMGGTCLESVVKQGDLVVNQLENGIYVYLYEGDLYWIVDKDYEFLNKSEWFEVQACMIETNNLVVSYKELGFRFSEYEIEDLKLGNYRVAKTELPDDVCIVKIRIGDWSTVNEWKWMENFRPRYVFCE